MKQIINSKSRAVSKVKKDNEANFYIKLLSDSKTFENLNKKERLFVINFCLCNGDRDSAMALCGYKKTSYETISARLLGNENVQKAIYEFWEIVFGDKIETIKHKLLDQLYRRAFTKRNKYFEADGSLKLGLSFDDLGEDECIIDGIERKFYGKDADVSVITYKLADRTSAYNQLMKMTGMDVSKFSISADVQQTTGVLAIPALSETSVWSK